MKMDIAIGEQTYIENVGTVNVYNDEVTGAYSNDGQFGVPQENVETGLWSSPDVGGVRLIEDASAGSKPGARPRISVVNSYIPASDYQRVMTGYAQAYRDETGKEPGPLPFIILLTPLLAKLIVAVALIIAAVVVTIYLIQKSTVNSVEEFTTEDGESVYRSCIGNLTGGVSCYWYNANTGKTSAAESTAGMNQTIKYIVIGVAAIGAVYIVAKVIPGLFPPKSSKNLSNLAVK
jgi:hypothetical protein